MTRVRVFLTIRWCLMLLLGSCGFASAQTVLQITTPLFPLTPVGQSVTKNVQLNIPNGGNSIVFSFIQLVTPSGDYSMGTITGCVVDGSTANVDGTVCTIPITFTPTLPGSATSPLPIARTATLQVYDNENGNIQNFGIGLIGGGTTPRAIVVPGMISDLAGNDAAPTSGFAGDGGPASGAVFNNPTNMAVDGSGNIYISDTANCVVRRIDKVSGTVSTFAGIAPSPGPQCGPGFDGAGPLSTMLNGNTGIAVDSAGNVYIADTGNGAVREVNPLLGSITTIAGQLNLPGYSGDGGPAVNAQLQSPAGIAVDGYGDVFIADSGNFVVREVSPVTGNIQTIAGVPGQQGAPGAEAYGIPATSFLLDNPQQVTVDSVGNVYIADTSTTGVIQVYAATQNVNLLFAVDGIPTSLAVDAADTLHATLTGQCGVYKLPVGTFQLVTIAGNGSCTASGDAGSALAAGLNNPLGVVVDGSGSFYILENEGVRFVDSTGTDPVAIAFGSQQVLAVSSPQSVLLFNGDVPTAAGATPNPLAVYLSQPVYSPFATVSPGSGITDCSAATSTVSISLNSAAYCELTFTFTPQVDSPFSSGTSLFELAPGVGTQITQAISLSGTGTGTPATASVMPSMALLTAGVMGGVAMQQFILTNTGGGAPLTVSSIGFANSAVPGFSETNNCTTTLTQNQTCTITVQYAPTVTGSVSQTLDVVDNAIGTPQTVALTGVGVAPTASLTPSSLNFSGVVAETVQEQAFTLTDTSSTAYLAVSSIYFPTNNGFNIDYANSTCISALIAPGATCSVNVTFTPGVTGSSTNTLTLTDNTAGGTETATVNGTGTAPVATFSAASIDFNGTVIYPGNQSAPQTVTLTNTGTAILHLSSIALSGDNPNAFQFSNNCPATLAIGASCNITAIFMPPAAGPFEAVITVTDDSGGQGIGRYVTQTIILGGNSPQVAQQSSFTIANTAFASTTVGSSISQGVALTLNSPSTVLKSIAMASGFTEFTVNSLSGCTVDGATANPAATMCTINISFTPTTVGLLHNAPLVVTTIEGGVAVKYFFGLSGASTGEIAALTPGLIYGLVASNGTPGGSNPLGGMGGPANNASVGFFGGFALDAAHDLYVSDSYFAVIYKVTPDGIINLYAGTPFATGGYLQTLSGDNGPALSATLSEPGLLALDKNGNLYVNDKDYFFHTELRVISPATNTIANILGANNPCASATDGYGDGCPGSEVAYSGAAGMAFGPDGNLYFSSGNGIHEYNTQTSVVTLFAGSGGSVGSGVDGGAALGAAMAPSALTFDNSGNMLFVDGGVHVRRIAAASGIIATIAGAPGSVLRPGAVGNLPCTNTGIDTASYHPSGDGGPATAAVFCDVTGVAVDPANNVYVMDYSASEIRRIDSGTGVIVPVTGQSSEIQVNYGDQNGPSYKHDDSAFDVSLSYPIEILLDGSANIYEMSSIGDVRMINVSQSSLYFTPQYNSTTNLNAAFVGSLTGPQQVTVVNAGNLGPVSFNPPFTTPALFGISTADFSRDTAVADCISTTAMLAPGTECPVNLDFTPTVAGSPITDTEAVNDTAGTQAITLVGYSAAVPAGSPPTLTPALLSFGGSPGVATPAQSFMLTNNLTQAIGITSISLTGVNPGAFMAANNCGASVAAGASCQISVIFTAPAIGNFIAQVSLVYTQTYAGTAYPATLVGGLTGIGGTPEGQFILDQAAGNSAQFGSQNVGTTSAVHSISFVSTGTVPLLLAAITLGGTNANQFAIASNNCPASLAPNAICKIGVTFTPTTDSPSTPFTAVLSAADNAADAPQQITLSGTGVGAAAAVLAITESVHVTDAPAAQTAVVLAVAEAVHVTDTPSPQEAMLLSVIEAVHVTDTPSPQQAMLLAVTESVHVTDTPSPQQAMLLAVTEAVHVTDTPSPQQALLLSITEAVHVTDAPKTSLEGHAQSITFTQPLSPVATGTGPYTLVAVSTSALPITFSVISGPGSISGNQLTITGSGTITVAADQAGGSGFLPAPEVQATVTVLVVPPVTPVPGGAAIPPGTTSAPFVVTVTFTSQFTLGSFMLATTGARGNDFVLTTGGSCAIGSTYTAGQSCTVMMTFTPTGPGVITGQLYVLDNQGNIVATAIAASVRYR
jgi:hypothetical protein